jgi:hypothetical protein
VSPSAERAFVRALLAACILFAGHLFAPAPGVSQLGDTIIIAIFVVMIAFGVGALLAARHAFRELAADPKLRGRGLATFALLVGLLLVVLPIAALSYVFRTRTG